MPTNYVLIDYENVQPATLSVLEKEDFKIFVFVGAHQTKVTFDIADSLQRLGANATYVKISGNGPNALDFHIAYYIGQLAAADPAGHFHIISKDTGFDRLIEHLKTKNIFACRSRDVGDMPLLKARQTNIPADKVALVLANLQQRGASKPRTVKTLTSTIHALFQKALPDDELSELLAHLETQGYITVSGDKSDLYAARIAIALELHKNTSHFQPAPCGAAMPTTLLSSDRIQGGIVGLLIGDALGVPYEFHPASAIPAWQDIEFTPPRGFNRAHVGVPPATWSDDGAQALCLLASLLAVGHFHARDFGDRLVRWYDQGYLAVDGVVFDVGITTASAIRALRSGADPSTAGPSDVSSNGNGALMRVLPLALWHKGSDEELVHDAQAQSKVTHGHLRSQVCCALYCLWARRILQDSPAPWQEAVRSIRAIYASSPAATEELE